MSQRTAGASGLSLGRAAPAGTPAAAMLPVPKQLHDDAEFAFCLATVIAQYGETKTARKCGQQGVRALKAGHTWRASCKGLCPAHAPRRRREEIERAHEGILILEEDVGGEIEFLTVSPSPEPGSGVSQVESSTWMLEQVARTARQPGRGIVAHSFAARWGPNWAMTAIPHSHICAWSIAIPDIRETARAAVEGVTTDLVVDMDDFVDDRGVTDVAGLAAYLAQDLSILPTVRADGGVTMSRPAAMWQAAMALQYGYSASVVEFAQAARDVGDAVRTRKRGPYLDPYPRSAPPLITRSWGIEKALRDEKSAEQRIKREKERAEQRQRLDAHRRILAAHHALTAELLLGLCTARCRLLGEKASAPEEPLQARARSPPPHLARCPSSPDPILALCPDRLNGASGRRHARIQLGNTETGHS